MCRAPQGYPCRKNSSHAHQERQPKQEEEDWIVHAALTPLTAAHKVLYATPMTAKHAEVTATTSGASVAARTYPYKNPTTPIRATCSPKRP